MSKTFLSVIGFSQQLAQSNKEVLVAEVFGPACLNTSFIYNGLKLWKYLKAIELIHCSNQSFMGSIFIFSNFVG